MPRTMMVLPTIRPLALAEFLDCWHPAKVWDRTLIVFDGPQSAWRLDGNRVDLEVLTWDDLEELPERIRRLFSRRSSAIRTFGMWRAYDEGAEVILNLDDDCFPVDEAAAWVARHLANFCAVPVGISSLPDLRVRGQPSERLTRPTAQAVASMGLWRGTADCYAADRTALPQSVAYQPPRGVRVASPHQMVPFSGMNFAIRREFLPALYFPPMGAGQPYHRFDDTWAGLPFQVLAAWHGRAWTVGEPWVEHRQVDGDLAGRIRDEAPGLAVNDAVWRWFSEQLDTPPGRASLIESVEELSARMRSSIPPSGMEADYWQRWADNLAGWGELFG